MGNIKNYAIEYYKFVYGFVIPLTTTPPHFGWTEFLLFDDVYGHAVAALVIAVVAFVLVAVAVVSAAA